MRRYLLAHLLVFTFLFCAPAEAQTDPLEGPIRTLFQQHFDAMKKENVDAVLATIHPQSPMLTQTESLLRQVFPLYDLAYEIRILKIEIPADALAYIVIEQTTRKVSGPEFRNNRIRSRSEIRKHDGKWRIFNSTIEDVQYLN